MKRIAVPAAFVFLLAIRVAAVAQPAHQTQPTRANTAPPMAQQTPSRDATREKLRTLLNSEGPKINVTFRQSEKQPYNFVGVMSTGLTNADSFEIVVGVTANETIGFRVFPHYKGAYINVDKVRDGAGLTRLMVRLSDRNFLYWGADQTFDIFAGYTFTLESGFPDEAIRVVLNSIKNLDQYVGEMKGSIE